jgi:hypothetical protein
MSVNPNLGPAGCAALGIAIGGHPALLSVRIAQNNMGDLAGATFFRGVKLSRTLSAVHAQQNQLGWRSMTALACPHARGGCPNSRLVDVWLGGNNIGGQQAGLSDAVYDALGGTSRAGAAIAAVSAGCVGLERLDLSRNPLGADEEAGVLALLLATGGSSGTDSSNAIPTSSTVFGSSDALPGSCGVVADPPSECSEKLRYLDVSRVAPQGCNVRSFELRSLYRMALWETRVASPKRHITVDSSHHQYVTQLVAFEASESAAQVGRLKDATSGLLV